MQIKLNLPLNTVNPKKPRMPNVANRVDAFVMCVFQVHLIISELTVQGLFDESLHGNWDIKALSPLLGQLYIHFEFQLEELHDAHG